MKLSLSSHLQTRCDFSFKAVYLSQHLPFSVFSGIRNCFLIILIHARQHTYRNGNKNSCYNLSVSLCVLHVLHKTRKRPKIWKGPQRSSSPTFQSKNQDCCIHLLYTDLSFLLQDEQRRERGSEALLPRPFIYRKTEVAIWIVMLNNSLGCYILRLKVTFHRKQKQKTHQIFEEQLLQKGTSYK